MRGLVALDQITCESNSVQLEFPSDSVDLSTLDKHFLAGFKMATSLVAPFSDRDIITHYTSRHEWIFEGPFYDKVATPRPEFLQEKDRTYLAERLQWRLLHAYLVKDYFKDHDERRRFLREEEQVLRQMEPWLDAHSYLRMGNLQNTLIEMSMIITPLETKHARVYEKLRTIFTPHSDNLYGSLTGYHNLDFREKFAIAKKIYDTGDQVLMILSQNSRTNRMLQEFSFKA